MSLALQGLRIRTVDSHNLTQRTYGLELMNSFAKVNKLVEKQEDLWSSIMSNNAIWYKQVDLEYLVIFIALKEL